MQLWWQRDRSASCAKSGILFISSKECHTSKHHEMHRMGFPLWPINIAVQHGVKYGETRSTVEMIMEHVQKWNYVPTLHIGGFLNATTDQALTTPRKISLPIGQPVGINQVAPIKIQVAPLCQALLVNKKVYGDFLTHDKIKWNTNGIRSIEKTIICLTKNVNFAHWTKYLHIHTYSRVASKFPSLRGESIYQKWGVLSSEEGAFSTYISFCQIRADLPLYIPNF